MSAAQAFWTAETDGHTRAVFAAEGVHCASCTRTIERAVRALPGIEQVSTNAATGRVSVDWKTGATALPQILQAIEQVGFKPIPMAGEGAESAFQRERRTALKRIGLAGLGMMQVMMYVLGVYIAEPGDLDSNMASFLNYTAMLITLPVLVYSGYPYFHGAWQGLRRRALNMDLTVALALLLAFSASVFNTIRGEGQTYFDSVTMFIFFLGTGRYLEMVVRNRSLSTSEALTRSLPATAARLRADGATDKVPIRELRIGDRIRIAKGAVVPVDAELDEANALLDEALITGESCAIHKRAGEVLLGGSINLGAAIAARVRQDIAGSTLASIVALLERAQRERPPVAQLADRIAAWFIAAILLVTVLVAACWLLVDPSRAFPAALAVLVVTCPCALSLATPTAIAAATTRLARMGLLVTRADALERLSIVDTVVLDKTGTLTSGTTGIVEVRLQGLQNREEALAIAAALERASNHPMAAAFASFATPSVQASHGEEITGLGMEGWIQGQRWRIGRPDFVLEITSAGDDACAADTLVLGNETGLVASFELGEQPRADALAAVAALRTLGLIPILASGDRREAVKRIARQLGISRAEGRLEPQEKISLLHVVQSRGARVLAVGDGINDGPVLAAADVSCAMGQGSAIAQAASDLLLLNDSLRVLPLAVQTARRMRTVIRQNLRWALFYNLAAVPLAAFGLIAPWVAAIGMSVSSLVVVLNARRLSTQGETR
jgi:P-type Cu2+ transporter